VLLTGSGFTADSAGPTTVVFGRARARDVVVLDDEHVSCTVFGGSPGALLDVTVRNANGSATLPDAYRVLGEPPAITAILPGAGPFTGGTRVTLEGRGFAAVPARVAFGGVPALDVVVESDARLNCLTPPGPVGERVTVVLSTKDGSAAVLDGYAYEDLDPELTGIVPVHGPSGGGTRVTLSGKNFTAQGAGPTRVRFGGVAAGNVVVQSDVAVQCDAPPGKAGARVEVALENDKGEASLPGAFRYHDRPTLSGLTPAAGRAEGGTRVTLTGSGFSTDEAGTNRVTFGGLPATGVSVLSDSELQCTTPSGVAGATVDVALVNRNGSATLAGSFRYYARPTLAGLSPSSGRAEGGTQVTLTGSGFSADEAGTNLVTFGGLPATGVSVLSDSELLCTTPSGAAGATVDVALANQNGSATLPGAFLYHAAPVLLALTPDHGPASGGDVLLSGSGFLAPGAGAPTLTFDGLPATLVAVLDDARVSCRAPAGAPGSRVDVTLANANGSSTLSAAYRYHAAPTLTGVEPSRGPSTGGTRVTLRGTGFQVDQPGATLVVFGGSLATEVVVLDDASVACTTPSGIPDMAVNVTLANANGQGTALAVFRYNAPPVLTALSPTSGSEQGGTRVTLTGSGFSTSSPGSTTVLFGDALATEVSVQSDATLTCIVPAKTGATTVDVTLRNENGTASLAEAFRYHPGPRLTALEPAHGSALGGATITLTGTGFAAPGAGTTEVTFGGLGASAVVVLDDSRAQCALPAGPVGAAVDVTLRNANGASTLPQGFRYHARPTLTAVLPERGSPTATTPVTLSGSGFLRDDAGENRVLFGAAPASAVVVLDDATLVCEVAPQAPGTVVGVSLANANGSATLDAAFAFGDTSLTAVTPPSGPAAGGGTVTLTGSGFLLAGAVASITFNGVAAGNVNVLDDTRLTCSVPAGAGGTTVEVALSGAVGIARLPSGYRYHALPTLASLTPADGTSFGGTLVTVRGSGFLNDSPGTNLIRFGSSQATAVVIYEDGRLTCRAPSGPAGTTVKLSLTNQNGAVELAGAYRYHAKPTLTVVTPSSGTALGGNRVTLTGTGFLADGAVLNVVTFGGITATAVTVSSDASLQCTVPAGVTGPVAVTVANVNGTALLANGYRYHAQPTLTAVTPPSGAAGGGSTVVLAGSGFQVDSPGPTSVLFGTAPATGVTVQSDGALQCTVPAGSSGTVSVSVINANGTALLAEGYRYHARPTLTALSPASGSVDGGTTVLLTGSGFQLDSPGPSTVTFGGAAASSVSVLSDLELSCVTPPGAPGTAVDVAVANANGAATLLAAFTYEGTAAAVVAGTSPSKGSIQGSTPVTVTGAGFRAGMGVSFGGNPAQDVRVLDSRTITCLTPPSLEGLWVDVSVQDAEGSARLPLGFRYVAPPTLVAVEPPTGDPAGDAMVVLVGSGFLDDAPGTTTVTFAGSPALGVTVHDDQRLSCLVPAGPALSDADVAVANENGTARLARGFRWQRRLATDLNRDGRGDLVLGSPGDDMLTRDAGAVHVFFGAPLPLPERSSAEADVTVLPERAATAFGAPVASGDLDGDGRAELLIGAPGEDQIARDAGAVFVFDGPMASATVPLAAGQARIVLSGTLSGDRFGSALALQDLDRNGFLELLVGAGGRSGAVHVFRGGPAGLSAQPALIVPGEFGSEEFATSLGGGDLDGDGWPELVVGAPNALGDIALSPTGSTWRPGEVRVYRGGSAFLSTPSPARWLTVHGLGGGQRFGATLAARDLSGDGIAELIVGSPASTLAGLGSGAAFVFLGRSGLSIASASAADAVLTAEAAGDRLGTALGAGDVDGDGLADLLVGAPGHAGGGRAYLFLGGPLANRRADAAEAVLQAEPGSSGEFGAMVSLVDADGDGLEDLVVTAPALGGELGRAYVFSGSAVLGGREAASSDGTFTGQQAGDRLGQAMNSDH
jgi:hypothetical protein